jgi:hypothetical protein
VFAQKSRLKPLRRQCWVIPPKPNSAFVAAMEDELAVYMRPRDPDRPLVYLDEISKQLTGAAQSRTGIDRELASPADALRVALMMLAGRGRLELDDVLKVMAPN